MNWCKTAKSRQAICSPLSHILPPGLGASDELAAFEEGQRGWGQRGCRGARAGKGRKRRGRGKRGWNRVNFPKPSSWQQTQQGSLHLQAYRKCIFIINSPGHPYPFQPVSLGRSTLCHASFLKPQIGAAVMPSQAKLSSLEIRTCQSC